MCCGPERLNHTLSPRSPHISFDESRHTNVDMNHLTVETDDAFASLLELAANNDVEGFKRSIVCDPSGVDEVGLWYGRQKGSKQMVNEQRTPLMVAATYGSIDIIRLILSESGADVNLSCGNDKSTALHCAASGGALNAVDVVKLLLAAGADPNLVDAKGHRPVDVIVVPPKFQDVRLTLEELLATDGSVERNLRVSTTTSNSNSPPLSPALENGSPTSASGSPMKSMSVDAPSFSVSEKKEYPIDPSLPDIKNSIYSTDEFRMYSFKVRPCSRAYSHDWTECPFVHPGENARRRDPRKFHYSCVPCPDFRKGACRRGDMCEYAHGVFECWLHPAQYRTRLCKDGTSCARRVCFFAHTPEELRPLYVSTGSAVPSPRSSTSGATAMDFAAALSLLPGSPSSVNVMSPSPFTPPMSPSANGISHSNVAWPQPNVPALHLPGSNLQSSRLRSSLNARDMPVDDFNMLPDFDVQQQQLLNELSTLSQPTLSSSLNRSGRMKTLTPSNLDDLFSAESSSPRYSDQALAAAVFSPTHKSAVLNQFQQQQQSMLSPINTNFSPKNVDHPLLQASFGVPSSSGRMSPRNVEPISPMGSRVSLLAQREKQQQFRSLSSRELGSNSAAVVGSPVNSWSKWGSSNGKPDWAVTTDELGKLKRSSSFELGNGEEPDLSWVQSLVKESPTEVKEKLATPVSGIAAASSSSEGSNRNPQIESVDHAVLGAWLEQMQLDQLVAQQN
ncbi:zinc finger CCCH domain-containing protein 30 [Citrus sinensis]|uniref:zinc finger CCCH domain-containing protein 30 n=1 Tax=Citrus sinensis TaxID=2711 RepID=UPI00219AA29C|nr:zinc finger CCCH domain-containing protein 30 [Citrus sinensis]XP_006493921.2 zinc finger CCCH domain-containing protein 30 [Citrus sinensis]KAH9648170.1 zinc finger CCCH domain-containing protein 30 [Citrus sinensis]